MEIKSNKTGHPKTIDFTNYWLAYDLFIFQNDIMFGLTCTI